MTLSCIFTTLCDGLSVYQVVSLCWTHGLYDAILYIYNCAMVCLCTRLSLCVGLTVSMTPSCIFTTVLWSVCVPGCFSVLDSRSLCRHLVYFQLCAMVCLCTRLSLCVGLTVSMTPSCIFTTVCYGLSMYQVVSLCWTHGLYDAILYIYNCCLLYTSDAADEEDSVDLGGRRI